MDEAILIEIAQRFRRLEDAVDLFLASFKELAERRIERAEAAHAAQQISYATFCARVNEPRADLLKLEGVRGDVEKYLEACREDMVNMQEFIRGFASSPAGEREGKNK